MKTTSILFLLAFTLACSPFRRTTFTYVENGKTITQRVIVPRGYRKTNTFTDSSGNILQAYDYRNRAFYYIAYVRDTNTFAQPIRLWENMPRQYINSGAWMYKGMDASHLFWKEVHRDNLRAGYLYVEPRREYPFDSASTYLAVMPLR